MKLPEGNLIRKCKSRNSKDLKDLRRNITNKDLQIREVDHQWYKLLFKYAIADPMEAHLIKWNIS